MNKNKAIGIFDSGIGGLTVAHEIAKKMPNEDLIYFGDTKHLPYGEKSEDAIVRFSKNITRFLIQHNCKMVVIACNTASALAYDIVCKECKNIAIPVNVIDPVVDFTCKTNAYKIGIIGTKNTICSNVYARKIKALNPKLKTNSLATPLLVPMIEEGFHQNKISKTILSNYLQNSEFRNIDHLILGCTHYPLIEEEIKQFYEHNIEIINSAKIVSKHVKETLDKMNLSCVKGSKAKHKFYVSDYNRSFEQSAQYFFGQRISLKQENI